ncbi:MAG TPA: hypothetical protein VHT96_13970 [Clostridia bacterium]|nr:hypothetical protein [Clostridia bacterium]
MSKNRKSWIILTAAAGLILALAVLGIIPRNIFPLAANAPEPLENLFYVKNGTLYFTPLDTIAPKEIVDYNLPPEQREVFLLRESVDGRRFFYPDEIDNTKTNYCADIFCYDMASKTPRTMKIDSDINNYAINQDGSKVFYLKDKALYMSNLSKTKKLADEVSMFFINKEGSRLMYLTPDSRLFHYTGRGEAKELLSGITLLYVSPDLNTVYYLKDKNLYMLKDGNDTGMLDTDVVSVQNIYADGSFYYLKTNYLKPFDYVNDDMAASDAEMKEPKESDYPDRKSYSEAGRKYEAKKARDEMRITLKNDKHREMKSLHYYSNGQSVKISGYCDNVWRDENHMVLWGWNLMVSDCGNDRPFMVYSQLTSDKINMSDVNGPANVYNHIMNNVIDNVEIYICGGSEVLGKLGDKKPVRVQYDTENNKIYFAVDHSENPYLYDLYCVTADSGNKSEVRKYAEDVYSLDILLGGNVVYVKSESNFGDGDLYVNNVKIDSFSNVRNWWTNSTNSFTYAGNISRYDHSFKLKLYKDDKITKVADKITNYISCFYGDRLVYLVWKNRNNFTGQVYLYDGPQANRLVDTEVNGLIPSMKNKYYSWWDDRLTHDPE